MYKKRLIFGSLFIILITFFISFSLAIPLVNLTSLSNNTYSNNLTQIFKVNITDSTPIQSAQLYIWNSIGNKINIVKGGNMWVADGGGSNSVTEITPSGAMTNYTVGISPYAIAFDGVNMWTGINSGGGNSVTKVLPNGTAITYSGTGYNPFSIAFDGVNMWTANYANNDVTK